MNINKYLAPSEYIGWQHPTILVQAKILAEGCSNHIDISRNCFNFVRDDIKHSGDYNLNPVTFKASDVLIHGTGFCYAKSHLLAALLRANNIAAGLCYQRLTITERPPLCLHGLNAVYLEDFGWYRMDARGNKPGVSAQFCPPTEQLAFAIVTPGKTDFSGICAEPISLVIQRFKQYASVAAVANNLPDIGLDDI